MIASIHQWIFHSTAATPPTVAQKKRKQKKIKHTNQHFGADKSRVAHTILIFPFCVKRTAVTKATTQHGTLNRKRDDVVVFLFVEEIENKLPRTENSNIGMS